VVETATSLEPLPTLVADVADPYEVLFPHSTCHVVDEPPGSTVPVTVAVLPETAVTGPVTAVGAAARAAVAPAAATTTAIAKVERSRRRATVAAGTPLGPRRTLQVDRDRPGIV
jgi:hypothetical protein